MVLNWPPVFIMADEMGRSAFEQLLKLLPKDEPLQSGGRGRSCLIAFSRMISAEKAIRQLRPLIFFELVTGLGRDESNE